MLVNVLPPNQPSIPVEAKAIPRIGEILIIAGKEHPVTRIAWPLTIDEDGGGKMSPTVVLGEAGT
jgi:hypothetical protein